MKITARAERPKDGFDGVYFGNLNTKKAFIVIIGDEADSFMNRACARWLTQKQNCGALCIGLKQHKNDEAGVHSWPLDIAETGARWLKAHGVSKVGIFGMSMQASLALAAASLTDEISLVMALSPCDFVPWGFAQGKTDYARHAEWPAGGSAFSWRGTDLAFQPACLEKRAYWDMFAEAQKKYKEMHSAVIFNYSERVHPVSEEAFIKIENIKGRIIAVGARDDSMWESARYIERMKNRLDSMGEAGKMSAYVYDFGTHLLVPENMLKGALPLIGGLVPKLYASGRKNPKECRKSRENLETRLTKEILAW